jgi:hypothetical protein
MKKIYEVEVTTFKSINDDDELICMYKFYTNKNKAFAAAKVLSQFYPNCETEILIKEYDFIKNECFNQKIIKEYSLRDKDENGQPIFVGVDF